MFVCFVRQRTEGFFIPASFELLSELVSHSGD
jgi:hypothetical protein